MCSSLSARFTPTHTWSSGNSSRFHTDKRCWRFEFCCPMTDDCTIEWKYQRENNYLFTDRLDLGEMKPRHASHCAQWRLRAGIVFLFIDEWSVRVGQPSHAPGQTKICQNAKKQSQRKIWTHHTRVLLWRSAPRSHSMFRFLGTRSLSIDQSCRADFEQHLYRQRSVSLLGKGRIAPNIYVLFP